MMSKAVFATVSRPMCPDLSGREPAFDRHPEDQTARELAAERARVLARRFRHDPLLGDREARLAAIRRRWYGWEDRSPRVVE